MEESGNLKDPHAYWNELPKSLSPESYIDLIMSAMSVRDPVYAAYRHYLEERFVLKELNINRKDHVLDLGCGFGRMSFVFSRVAARVDGVDFSKRYIEIAHELKEKNQIGNVNFTCSPVLEFSPDPEGYDLMFMGGLLLYIEKDAEVLALIRKMKHFIRPNGRFVIREPSPNDKKRILRDHLTFRTIDELVRIFETADLHLRRICEAVPIGAVFYKIAAAVSPHLRRPESVLSEKAWRLYQAQGYFDWILKPIALGKNALIGQKADFRFYFHIYAAD